METVLIVGGALGGSAICRKYHEAGCNIILLDIDIEAGSKLINQLNGGGKRHKFCDVDVTDVKSLSETFVKIGAEISTLEHLVLVAGGALQEEWGGIEKCSFHTIIKSTELNLLSCLYILKLGKSFIIKSKSDRKSIVFISSINVLGAWNLPVYSAAKAGLEGLMNGLANEFTLTHGVRINIVMPGTIPSPRTEKQPKDFESLRKHMLLPDFPTHEEVADAVFMFTHRLPHCTQQCLIIDSGQSKYVSHFVLES